MDLSFVHTLKLLLPINKQIFLLVRLKSLLDLDRWLVSLCKRNNKTILLTFT